MKGEGRTGWRGGGEWRMKGEVEGVYMGGERGGGEIERGDGE